MGRAIPFPVSGNTALAHDPSDSSVPSVPSADSEAAAHRTYADLAFARMKPLFEASHCEFYKEDFYRHDRDILSNSAVPGAEYIWFIGKCGTHLLMPDSYQMRECLEQVLREHNPDESDLYHVRVHASSASVTGINDVRARALALKTWQIETRRDADRSGLRPATYSFHQGTSQVACATISVRYVQEGNLGWTATVVATIPGYLSQHTQMVLSRLCMDAVVRECGTLFSRVDAFTVNDTPLDDWIGQLTAWARASPRSTAPGWPQSRN